VTTTIAQVSDLHVLALEGVSPLRFLNKRLTGVANLLLGRRGAHPRSIQRALVADLAAQELDHVVVTGDLTNLALEPEFEAARRLLEPLGGPDRLSLVPGNHDVYTRGAERSGRFERYFAPWLGQDPPLAGDDGYPWHKRVGEVHVVGLCSARARLPLLATGRVGDAQLARLAQLAERHRFRADGAYVVALVHHNLHRRGLRKDRLHGLEDRVRVLTACREAGVDLLLHGHTHVAHRFRVGDLHVVGCGSSTWSDEDAERVARYNIYRVQDGALRSLEVRRYDPASGSFTLHASMDGDAL
jgi:3',5'-cyclic AMP phosphodiesterase CpdA